MESMIQICLENKITTFDHHADIYGSYTTESDFGKAFAASKSQRKTQLISKCGIQIAENRNKILSSIMITQKNISSLQLNAL
jgi:predicted oxidoreductase